MKIDIYFMTMPCRRDHVMTQISKVADASQVSPISTEIIEAYDDDKMELPLNQVIELTPRRKSLCALTYIKTLKHFIDADSDVCVVFEDDIDILPIFFEHYQKLSEILLNSDYDLIYLTYHQTRKNEGKTKIEEHEFMINNLSWGNLAIIWKRSSAVKFLSLLPITDYKDIWMHGKFKTLTTVKKYVDNLGARYSGDRCSKMGSTIYPAGNGKN